MTSSTPARTKTRRPSKLFVAVVLAVISAIAATLGCQSPHSSSSTAASPTDASRTGPGGATNAPTETRSSEHRGAPAPPIDVLRSEHHGALGVADGVVPKGTTVFDDDTPAVANLEPDLLRALRRAATDADGEEFYVNSGWRTPAYQERLLDEAVSEYGSREKAARWVATSTTSAHVSGDAVDIGHSDAASWLSDHGAQYGLCQIYKNEPWHFELRPGAADHGCPAMYADPTRDPRMQQ